ncbi:hypothetical protein Tco_1044837 [Tanacetum coccineum]|uniref:Zinc finger, CCHC-type n=1 Tax=Tanacetum coccineum TaxID=301880 RepID=A0ABQ5GT88_9ASTR
MTTHHRKQFGIPGSFFEKQKLTGTNFTLMVQRQTTFGSLNSNNKTRKITIEHLSWNHLLHPGHKFSYAAARSPLHVSKYRMKVVCSYVIKFYSASRSGFLSYPPLNKDFDSFVQNYNMHDMGKTVNELHAMLKLHEETLPKKDANPALHAIRAGRC